MKKNLKHYNVNRNTMATVFEQLHRLIPGKNNGRNDIVDVCQDIIKHSDPYIQYWFMWVWLRIIHETGDFYNSLSAKQKGYYRDAFKEKLYKKFWNRFMEKFGDIEFVPGVTTITISHLQNLFHAYLEQQINKPVRKR